MRGKRTPTDPMGRLLSRIEIDLDTECWIWQGAKCSEGYGSIGYGPTMFSTHRLAYERLVGPIPSGLHIDHLCRVRACCNPDHLEPVTQLENTRRGIKGEVTGDPAKLASLRSEYEAGATIAEMCVRYGCSTNGMAHRLRVAGTTLRPRYNFPTDPDEIRELGERYYGGETSSAIADEYGMSLPTFYERLRRVGIKPLPAGTRPKSTDGVVADYLAGLKPAVLVGKYGVSEETIRRRVKAAGGTMRPRGGRQK